jgi:hypothetical protein
MFYFISQFFRPSPRNNASTNATLATNPINGFTPGKLFSKGDLLDMYMFINEDEIYTYDP